MSISYVSQSQYLLLVITKLQELNDSSNTDKIAVMLPYRYWHWKPFRIFSILVDYKIVGNATGWACFRFKCCSAVGTILTQQPQI